MAGQEIDLVPTIDEFRPYVLRVLSDGEAWHLRDLRPRVAELIGLADEALEQAIPSGKLRYANRITWACSGLKHGGLIESPQRGMYRITDDGLVVDARNLTSYSDSDMEEWPAWRAYREEVAARKKQDSAAEPEAADGEVIPVDNPVEVIEAGVAELNAEVETRLRRKLQEASPEFFEKAVVDLLWAMGYGGAHGEKKHVGKSGDGGIDGVIRQDALGLQNIYVQAKRYADTNTVQRPEIQQFFGALASRGAERGVFITTSKFTAGAVREAELYQGKIILIDGIRLTRLMLNYGVAVQRYREYVVYEVDEDFFDEEGVLS